MHVFWRVNSERNKTKIFTLKLLCNIYRNTSQPRARLYGKYTKWKNRTRAKHTKYNKWKLRNILVCDANRELEEENNYFRQQILDLQNNIQPPNRNMAGYELPKFRGLTDPEDFH